MTIDAIRRRFKPEWITNAIDEDCMNLCEELAKDMVNSRVSSSFLRNIFGELRRIEIGGFEKHRADFVLLRPKLAYTCSRTIERARSAEGDLASLQELYKLSASAVKDANSFKNIVSIMEAIIAFHKAYGNNK